MPELPEVEVTRRSIAGVEGAQVLRLALGKPLRWPLGIAPQALEGARTGAVGRRGKYLILPLTAGASGGRDGVLLWHLGMSGSLGWWPAGTAVPDPGPHDHAELLTDQGRLRLTDPRRFGAVVWSDSLASGAAARLLAPLGPEPFDPALTPARFHAAMAGRRVAVKPWLLAGQAVVGAGNIYASEALFLARIDPRTPAEDVGPRRAARLLEAVRHVLDEAISMGGSTLRDFRDAQGLGGHYQGVSRVYGREGEPCPQCGAPVRRIVQGQRATYFCPSCQRR